jgi:methylated-DNA-[protein]-cysteine S-methyltransferase
MTTRTVSSPLGPLRLTASPTGLCGIDFASPGDDSSTDTDLTSPVLDAAAAELVEYFTGSLREFTIAREPAGTQFQREVWAALEQIPFGTTISYQELAERIGRPTASRAVGAANGRNPLPIVVPCHRVIGADGRLVGYSGGLQIKHTLLMHEGWAVDRR